MGIRGQHVKIEQLTRDETAQWKFFKVTVPRGQEKTVLHTSNWPNGLVIRPFRAPRDKSSHPKSSLRAHHATSNGRDRNNKPSRGSQSFKRPSYQRGAPRGHNEEEYYHHQAPRYDHPSTNSYDSYDSYDSYITRYWDNYDREYPVYRR